MARKRYSTYAVLTAVLLVVSVPGLVGSPSMGNPISFGGAGTPDGQPTPPPTATAAPKIDTVYYTGSVTVSFQQEYNITIGPTGNDMALAGESSAAPGRAALSFTVTNNREAPVVFHAELGVEKKNGDMIRTVQKNVTVEPGETVTVSRTFNVTE